MKAISFLEYVTDRLQYINSSMYEELIKATEFYWQPLSPELIEKYFEDCSGVKLFWETYHYGSQPKILDNFITDCERIPIDLTFNQTAISELNLNIK